MGNLFEWPKLNVKIRGKPHTFDLARYTPAESQLYEQNIGIGMLAGLQQPEIHTVLGFLWIEQRRKNNRLTWPKFAESWTGADVDFDAEADEDEPEPEVEMGPT